MEGDGAKLFANPEEKLKSYGGLVFLCGIIIALICLAIAAINPILTIPLVLFALAAFLLSFLSTLVMHAFADMCKSLKAIQKDVNDICGTQKGMYKTQKGMFQYQLKTDKE